MGPQTVAVFGLGKLGATLAGVLAAAGHTVRGYDVQLEAIEAINSATPLSYEPGLKELLEENRSRLRGFSEAKQALDGTDAAYIIVPTPSGPGGTFINDYVTAALKEIGAWLRGSQNSYKIVISSTVMPGSCTAEFIPTIESESGLTVGDEVGLIYSPEFIALGSVVKDMRFPDLVLIGESDVETGSWYSNMAMSVVKSSPEVRRMGLVSAELTKIAINTFVTTKISFANMLSEMCDRLDGANIDDVTGAVGADSRVGHRYLRGGLGYGGPCFPRDNVALSQAAKKLGVSADIAIATDAVNDRQVERVARRILDLSEDGDLIAIIGLAYKNETPVIEASQAVDIGRLIAQSGRRVIGIDKYVRSDALRKASSGILLTDQEDAIQEASVILIANPRNAGDLRLDLVNLSKQVIIDLWGFLELEHPNVIRPGRNSKEKIEESLESR